MRVLRRTFALLLVCSWMATPSPGLDIPANHLDTPANPGDVTTINFPKASGIDDKVHFAGDPITMTVEVHVHPPPGNVGICATGTITVGSGDKTRREMAMCMAVELKEDLVAAGLTVEQACKLVKVHGATIYVCGTPPGEGPNTGTPDDPNTSPDPPNPNRIHASSYTEGQG